jgi:nitroimidazol reductase NimA-like FMN-containing flavoprotein (pyridoxamine 5'-phosphate oxidase superfamily)
MSDQTRITPRPPSPAVLMAYDCWGLLETEEIARIAWAGPDGVSVVPVNYVVASGALWFRAQPESALGRQSSGGRVVVEVDHVDRRDRSAWSVVVVGTAEPVDMDEVPEPVMEMQVWPVGPHGLFVRVEPDDVTGRRLGGRVL